MSAAATPTSSIAHDGQLERAVEVHSTWGTFEWLLHDAFDTRLSRRRRLPQRRSQGPPRRDPPRRLDLRRDRRPDLLSDAGARPATRCSRRCARAVTTARPAPASSSISVRARSTSGRAAIPTIPQLGPAQQQTRPRGADGRHRRPGGAADASRGRGRSAPTPIERVDILHGKNVVQTVRPFASADLGRRVRVMWQRRRISRPRARGDLAAAAPTIDGNRIARFAPVNFLNPERKVARDLAGRRSPGHSVTTGNLAGFDLWLEERAARHARDRDQRRLRRMSISPRSSRRDVRFDGGGLGRAVRVYRLPEARLEPPRHPRARRDLHRRRRPPGLHPRDAGRRPPGLDEPDLSDRMTQARPARPARGHHCPLAASDVPAISQCAALRTWLPISTGPEVSISRLRSNFCVRPTCTTANEHDLRNMTFSLDEPGRRFHAAR